MRVEQGTRFISSVDSFDPTDSPVRSPEKRPNASWHSLRTLLPASSASFEYPMVSYTEAAEVAALSFISLSRAALRSWGKRPQYSVQFVCVLASLAKSAISSSQVEASASDDDAGARGSSRPRRRSTLLHRHAFWMTSRRVRSLDGLVVLKEVRGKVLQVLDLDLVLADSPLPARVLQRPLRPRRGATPSVAPLNGDRGLEAPGVLAEDGEGPERGLKFGRRACARFDPVHGGLRCQSHARCLGRARSKPDGMVPWSVSSLGLGFQTFQFPRTFSSWAWGSFPAIFVSSRNIGKLDLRRFLYSWSSARKFHKTRLEIYSVTVPVLAFPSPAGPVKTPHFGTLVVTVTSSTTRESTDGRRTDRASSNAVDAARANRARSPPAISVACAGLFQREKGGGEREREEEGEEKPRQARDQRARQRQLFGHARRRCP